MPVLLTRPETTLVRVLAMRIAATGGQVRAYGGQETPVADLRAAGVICAVGSLLDEGHLESAMEQVHTVVHVAAGVEHDDPDLLVEEAATVVSAAVGAGVRRLVAVSLIGADMASADPLARAAGEVEEMVAATPFPSVVVRTSLVDSPEVRAALARAALGREALDARVAPVAFDDLAAVLHALDDRRDEIDADHVTLDARGSRSMTVGEYLDAVGITPISLVGRMIGRLRSGEQMLAAVEDRAGGEARSAWEVTGVRPTTPA